MTNEDLKQLCSYWQKVLRLQDWDVVIKTVRIFDIDPDTMGTINFNRQKNKAIIKIIEASDYDNADFPLDQEQVLVHELLHLQFETADNENGICPDGVEIGIDKTAQALVNLNRKGGDR